MKPTQDELLKKIKNKETIFANIGIDIDNIDAFVEGIESGEITQLNLDSNQINDWAVYILAGAISESKTFSRLSLRNCKIGDSGFLFLLLAMEQCATFRHLDLSDNLITEFAKIVNTRRICNLKNAVVDIIPQEKCEEQKKDPILTELARQNVIPVSPAFEHIRSALEM